MTPLMKNWAKPTEHDCRSKSQEYALGRIRRETFKRIFDSSIGAHVSLIFVTKKCIAAQNRPSSKSTDAAPDTLADYVIALLKHDKDMNALQSECKNELKDFISGGNFPC